MGMKLSMHFLRGLSGELELGRICWAAMVLAYIVYQGLAIWLLKQAFSPTEFGLGGAPLLAAGGFGVAVKDKGVASAKATAEDGAQ
jgi:hypothetical protein